MTRVTPAAPHQRFCAKGKSMLIVRTTTSLPKAAASLLKRLVCRSHTEVSSDGTTERITFLPFNDESLNSERSLAANVQSGADWPTATSLPTKVTGFPLS